MRTFIILFLLVGVDSFAQTPEKDFFEISPEQEKKIEDLKRKEEAARLLALKKAEEQNRKEEEDKRLKAEAQKKAEAEAYTKWLISERDRKMREAALNEKKGEMRPEVKEAKKEESGYSPVVRSAPVAKGSFNGKIPNTRAEGLEEWYEAHYGKEALEKVNARSRRVVPAKGRSVPRE